MEPPLLIPVTNSDDKTQATFVDCHGEVVALPNNLIVPFARLAAREKVQRIKRYHLSSIYRPSLIPGRPKVWKAGIFDIITPDLLHGPIATGAEILAVVLDSFPNLTPPYELHSDIVTMIVERIPSSQRTSSNTPNPHRLRKRQISSRKACSVVSLMGWTCLQIPIDDDIDAIMSRLETTNTWDSLFNTPSHKRFHEDHVLKHLKPLSNPIPHAAPSARYLPASQKGTDLYNQLIVVALCTSHTFAGNLHILGHRYPSLLRLAPIIYQIAMYIRPEWADYWRRTCPQSMSSLP
ncbi:hypothetical protein GGU11DRAFT_51609 [Lentinula aff. detonsa]|nr:hypothetical protein GGU11DRAFT_51609 [Lentinula aff. detonsa]